MALRYYLRLFLVLVLAGNSLAAAGSVDAPFLHAKAAAQPVMPVTLTGDAATCHEAVSGTAVAPGVLPPAQGLPHCCNDIGHCVCALQSQALPSLVLPLPGQSLAGLMPSLAWPSRTPVPLLRPPIC
ncbi:MAG: hypothetical protein V4729_08730 [Pseudomonadota bacterium]